MPPPENHGLCVRTRLELKSHFFCLFALLASVVLLYCFTCLCPVEGVYVVCESWRQVIKERLQRQNETQTKDEAKWSKNKTPHLRLRRWRGRVASEDNSNHPPFCFRRQLLSKQKEMSCYRFRQRDCKCTWSNIHRLGTPILIALGTVAEKIRIPYSHAKKIRIRNLRFRKIHFRERFRKAPFWGPSVFKKLRIRADTCDRFYVSGVEKLRFRKDPGTCARSLRDGSSGPGPGLVHTLCYAENSEACSSFVNLSRVLLSHVPARIFLFKADGSWIFRLANGWFFFVFSKKVVQLAGKPFEGLSDSRSTCTAHLMRSPCCPRRNQHCYKSLESWLIGKTEIFRDQLSSEHEHGCQSGMHRLATFSSALPVPRELKTWAAVFFLFFFLSEPREE